MKVRFYTVIISLLICFSETNADSNLNVVVSIKPFHSLISGVMLGVARPELLLRGNFSPHTYSLKPSDAKKLQYADLVFWGGEALEGFLAKPISSLSKNAEVFSILGINGLKLRFFSAESHIVKSEIFESYSNNLPKNKGADLKAAVDPHIWLDPENAKVITQKTVRILSDFDPENAQIFQKNGEKIIFRLNELDQQLSSEMSEIPDRTYLVLHDAYQYFESRYQLKSAGSITLQLEHFLGVSRLKKVQKMIKTSKVRCIFTEPQYSQKLVNTLIKDTSVKKGILDPIGADILPGPELYFDLLKNLSISLKSCLN
jgi:zinc transport system substrate-binding protein